MEQPVRSVASRKWLRWGLAAAAIALLLVCAYLFVQPASNTPQQIFAQYYQPHELPFGTRDQVTDVQYYEAGSAYQSEDYKKALPLLQAIYDKDKSDDRIGLALAISAIEEDQDEVAENILQILSNKENYLYQEQAQWYLALTYLKLNQIENSKKLLQSIIQEEGGFYSEQAKELLAQLEG